MNTIERIQQLDREIEAIQDRLQERRDAFEAAQEPDRAKEMALCKERDKLCRQRIQEIQLKP